MSAPNYWTWTKNTPQKNWSFWSNPWSYDNFSHKNALVIWPHLQYNFSHVIKFYWWYHGQKLWCINFISKYLYFILRRHWVNSFADIVKFATIFIKTIFKDSKMLKEFRNYLSKSKLHQHFLLDLRQVRCNRAKSHHCKIYMTNFREGAFLAPSTRE